jgi:serine protease inhibitor
MIRPCRLSHFLAPSSCRPFLQPVSRHFLHTSSLLLDSSNSVSTAVSTLEIASNKWLQATNNLNEQYAKANPELFKTVTADAIKQLQAQFSKHPKKGENFVISPLAAGVAANQALYKQVQADMAKISSEFAEVAIDSSQKLQFSGYLAPKFEISNPSIGPTYFKNPVSGPIPCAMLIRSGKLYYTETTNYQVVELPYLINNYVLTIVQPRTFSDQTITNHPQQHLYEKLPREKTTIDELLQVLTPEQLLHDLTNLTLLQGTVAVPAFIAESAQGRYELSYSGLKLGAKALRHNPNVGTQPPRFFVSCHKPFLFFLRHQHSGAALLAGVTQNVTKMEQTNRYGLKGIKIR